MPNESPGRSSFIGPLGCFLSVLALLIFTPAVGLAIYLSLASGRVEDGLAQVRAAGEPLTAAELEDFYAVPAATDPTPLWLDAVAAIRTLDYNRSAKDLPIVGSEAKVPLPGQPWPHEPAALAHLTEFATTVEQLHAAAEVGGPARYPTDFTQGTGMLLPHADRLRQAARLLNLDARVQARQGNARGAAQSLHAMFALAQSLEREPIIVSQLVRAACAGMGITALADLLPHIEFAPEDLTRLQADLEAIDYRAELQRALLGERVIGVGAFENAMVSGVAASAASVTRRDDLALYLDCMQRYNAAARTSWKQAKVERDATERMVDDLMQNSLAGHSRYSLTKMVLPAIDSAFEAAFRSEARSRAAAVAIAVERRRLHHGRLPETLSQLVPDFLARVPADPFDDQPLRYRVEDEGYTIYSVGIDGVDDQGTERDDRAEPDIVVTIRRAQED